MKKIASLGKDFSQWYNRVVLQAQLADYSPVRGCMVIRPYGWAIWEQIQAGLDQMIKAAGVKNAYFPLFIPYSFLEKEKAHVKGFSPELALVTHGGGKELKEPLVVRPTSETIMYRMYAKWIQSYRDLPLKLNQWANVVRWELRTYLFLRTMEFLWQEGHTAHANHQEAQEEVQRALLMYRDFYRDYLALEPFVGEKSERERFAGALQTFSTEILVRDGKFVQAATSHDLGQNFSKTFEIQFQDQDGQLKYVWQTSWGLSTRAIGALIMAHGDDRGLILPPKVAPVQVVIVPIPGKTKEEKLREFIASVVRSLRGIRVEVDWREGLRPGYKFNDWELRGVPLRLEVGDRETREGAVTIVSRIDSEKLIVNSEKLKLKVDSLLAEFQNKLLGRYRQFVRKNTHLVNSWQEFRETVEERRGAILAHWCGSSDCEAAIKTETKATTRVLPLTAKKEPGKCVWCNQAAQYRWVFGRGY